MALCRLNVSEEKVPPVGVGIIVIYVASAFLTNGNPRAVRMFGLVVAADPELDHILIRIRCSIDAGIRLIEKVIDIDRVVTPCLEIGRNGRSGPSITSAICDCSLAVFIASALGCNEDYTVSSARSVDSGRGCILDHGNALHIHRVKPLEVALCTIDKYERITTVDRGQTADVDSSGLSRTAG